MTRADDGAAATAALTGVDEAAAAVAAAVDGSAEEGLAWQEWPFLGRPQRPQL